MGGNMMKKGLDMAGDLSNNPLVRTGVEMAVKAIWPELDARGVGTITLDQVKEVVHSAIEKVEALAKKSPIPIPGVDDMLDIIDNPEIIEKMFGLFDFDRDD